MSFDDVADMICGGPTLWQRVADMICGGPTLRQRVAALEATVARLEKLEALLLDENVNQCELSEHLRRFHDDSEGRGGCPSV